MVKVGANLYRNASSGTYYALVKKEGKQIRRSLKTKDPQLAWRRLKGFCEQVERVDPPHGKVKKRALQAKHSRGRANRRAGTKIVFGTASRLPPSIFPVPQSRYRLL